MQHAEHKKALKSKEIKACAAACFYEIHVDFNECQKALSKVDGGGDDSSGPLQWFKRWITNEHQHSGLRDDGSVIFDTLWKMAHGCEQLSN